MGSPTSPDLDTASVAVTVAPLVPVSGKGDVRYTATVQLDIGGVVIELRGWTLRQDKRGHMRCFQPAYRDFRAGAWESCVTLPDDLLRAVGEAVLSQVPGAAYTVRLPAVDAA